jgi:HAD superfamily hydrolase (TIGR01549 family)
MLPATIKLILFDLHGTLERRVPSVYETVLAFAGDLGYSFAPNARLAGVRWAQTYWASTEWSDESHDEADPLTFWVSYLCQYLAVMGVPEGELDDSANRIGQRFLNEYAPKSILAHGVKPILWELREKQWKLGLLSNQREPLTGVAIELGIIEHFEFTLSSGQIGSRKPDPRLFEQALIMAGGVHPEEAVHIGDNYYTDVIGAQRAGLYAVLLDEYGAFAEIGDDCLRIRRLTDLPALLPF